MRKVLFALFSLVVLLAACAGPAALESPTALPAASTAAPNAEQQEAVPTPPAAAETESLPPTGCADIPLGQAMIGNIWGPDTRRHEIQPVEPETGLPLCGYTPFPTVAGLLHAFSADRRQLALVELPDQSYASGTVHLIHISTWQEISAPLPANSWVSRLAFDPSGSRLALFQVNDRVLSGSEVPTYTLSILDTQRLELIAQTALDLDLRLLSWSEDGSEVLAFGSSPVPSSPQASSPPPVPQGRVVVFDSATLEPQWEEALPDVRSGVSSHQEDDGMYLFDRLEPGIALTSDRRLMYIAHADEDRLTTIDFAARQTSTVPIQKQSARGWDWFGLFGSTAHAKGVNGTEKFALLLPDEQRLVITGATDLTGKDEQGNWQFERISLGLKVVDPATGAELEFLDTDSAPSFMNGGVQTALDSTHSYLYLLGYLPDGKERSEVVDLEQMKVVKRLEGESLSPAQRLDGSPILISVQYRSETIQVSVFDPQFFEPLHTWHPANPRIQGFPLLY